MSETKQEIIDNKVLTNSVIIPLILFGLMGLKFAIGYVVFSFILYMILLKYLEFTEEEKKYKQISYIRVLLYFYLPSSLFFLALSY